MKKVLVFGSLNYDLTLYVDELPKKGETITSKEMKYSIGGKGANQAATLAKLGLEVYMVGKIGRDDEGKKIIEKLKSLNVNVESIIECDKNTGKAFITVNKKGKNTIVISGGANSDIDKNYITQFREKINSVDAVLMQLEIPLEAVKECLTVAKELNKLTILNPAPAIMLDEEVLSKVDILIPNETELGVLYQRDVISHTEILNACKYLNNNGVNTIIVTLGKKGCALFNKNELTFYEPHDAIVVDTTAAGDSFIGGFLYSYLNDKGIEKSIDFGQKVSAITVSREGALAAIPTINEIINP
ncbi:MAG: ribokinase [Pleomorphochaeta sp.]